MTKFTHIGQWLYHFRSRKGLLKKDIKVALGIEYEGFIENIEAGRRQVPSDKVEVLCRVLNCPVDTYIEASVKDYEANLREEIQGTKGKPLAVEASSNLLDVTISNDPFGGLL